MAGRHGGGNTRQLVTWACAGGTERRTLMSVLFFFFPTLPSFAVPWNPRHWLLMPMWQVESFSFLSLETQRCAQR